MIDRAEQYALLAEGFVEQVRIYIEALRTGRLSVEEFVAELEADIRNVESAFGIQPASTSSQR